MPALALALQLLAITHATVIDPDAAAPRRDMTILVRATRVVRVAPSATVQLPAGAQVIDATGKFVIPGMWDMHVHNDFSGGRALLPLYIAHGVTGVRDMNGRLATLRAFQRDIAAGTLVGPRMVVSGPYLVGRPLPPAFGMEHFVVTDSASAVRGVDTLVALGVDFIKVHNWIPAPAARVIAAEARRRNVVYAGHVALPRTPVQAAREGQRSQEHLYAFVNQCSASDSAVIAGGAPLQRFLMGGCTSSSQASVYAQLARARRWVTPTLIVQEALATMRPTIVAGDSTAQFYNDTLMRRIALEMELPSEPPPATVAAGGKLFEKRLALVRALHLAGVPLLGGTDTPLAAGGPGKGLMGELQLLVKAGLSPRAALRTVTTEPARYFATDSIGAVAAGRLADLVILDANPLTDIGNLTRIHTVVANGRAYDAAARGALVDGARRAARASGR
ncbi:MAG: amidohydrolase family protein [Gemmatimonadaceae bacterium]|nr:amidohydrolase family protein [Gemmatimonadaceae bacterium]